MIDFKDISDEEIIDEVEKRQLAMDIVGWPAHYEDSLDDWSTDDLLAELASRDTAFGLLNEIHQLRRCGLDYQNQLNKYICDMLGVIL